MPIPQKVLQKLYVVDQNSMHDISVALHCSIHKVEYWLKKYNISRRSQSAANYIKYNPNGEPFHIKEKMSASDLNLYYLSLGLYWGEGGKSNYQSARLTNSDPALIAIYYKFLLKVCGLKAEKVHFHLQTFKDNDIVLAKEYWAEKLNISPALVHTSKPIPSQGKGTYKRISAYGVMTVGVYNTHFRTWMMEQLQKLGYNPD